MGSCYIDFISDALLVIMSERLPGTGAKSLLYLSALLISIEKTDIIFPLTVVRD